MHQMENNSSHTILQWNCQGLRAKKDELSQIINLHKPTVLALQETKLGKFTTFSLPHYSSIRREGHFNVTPHGGVALFIHESIPYQELNLNCELQAVAAIIHLGINITVCSIYTSRSHNLTINTLQEVINQLPTPIMLLGDFNSYSTMWGCRTTDARGRTIEEILDQNQLNILNTGTPTRISYNTESAIDLSIVTPHLATDFIWAVASSPEDSDHCPIFITKMMNVQERVQTRAFWNMKKAVWEAYEAHEAWNRLIDCEDSSCEEVLQLFSTTVNDVSTACIPRIQIDKYFPKPYWTQELKETRRIREKLYEKYRRNKSVQNAILWKQSRAVHRKLLRTEGKKIMD